MFVLVFMFLKGFYSPASHLWGVFLKKAQKKNYGFGEMISFMALEHKTSENIIWI